MEGGRKRKGAMEAGSKRERNHTHTHTHTHREREKRVDDKDAPGYIRRCVAATTRKMYRVAIT